MKNLVSAALFWAVIAAASAGWSATIYVDAANNTGLEDGSTVSPYNTVAEALNAALAEDVVSVAPGIYYGELPLPQVKVSVVSQQGPGVTILDGMNEAYAIVNAWNLPYNVNITFDGFTMTNAQSGVYVWTAFQNYHSVAVTLRNCLIRDMNIGVRSSIQSKVILENSVILNTDYAFWSIWCQRPDLRNVTIDKTRYAIMSRDYGAPYMVNSTITNAETAFSLNGYAWMSGTNNNVWNFQNYFDPNAYLPGTLNLTDTLSADPLFVAPPEDFTLQADSPLIDAGIDIGLPFEGAAPDIGAFEYTNLPLPEQVAQLATSFAEAPPEIYRTPGEQRRHAAYLKLMAIVNMVATLDRGNSASERTRALTGCLNKLQSDVLAKVDGNNGGNPANDWIVDPAEKTEFYNHVIELIDMVQAEIATINGL